MILPYETSYSFWLQGVSRYAWEPLQPPAPPADACGGTMPNDPAATPDNTGDVFPPALRLVFKGTDWIAYRVTWVRPNPGWELATQLQRDNMESRAEEQERERERDSKRPAPRPVQAQGLAGIQGPGAGDKPDTGER